MHHVKIWGWRSGWEARDSRNRKIMVYRRLGSIGGLDETPQGDSGNGIRNATGRIRKFCRAEWTSVYIGEREAKGRVDFIGMNGTVKPLLLLFFGSVAGRRTPNDTGYYYPG